jgi:putative transposase
VRKARLYLATVIDLGSHRLIGWSMGSRHEATLVIHALKMAVASRGRRKMAGTIFHHDRGSATVSLILLIRRGRGGSCHAR